ncbi:Major apurinic/apyrimidinic endonuclease/3'-repair diesterase APN1 [Ceraceosorus bombacis]|uniref:Apurinic-apyrimidinic endonuclease 1 n=1 Tax=Ceraceosorus bombacis TaxID=401625 RepID=A0A0P1BJV0_9BASI|nr:Major apurinic/apyrimidinic endonuclease/3'-repair diesterase APN1 [Ceraceosorus bombacis]
MPRRSARQSTVKVEEVMPESQKADRDSPSRTASSSTTAAPMRGKKRGAKKVDEVNDTQQQQQHRASKRPKRSAKAEEVKMEWDVAAAEMRSIRNGCAKKGHKAVQDDAAESSPSPAAEEEPCEAKVSDAQGQLSAGPGAKKKRTSKSSAGAQQRGQQADAARVQGSKYHVGAHISMAGGIENSVKNALNIGGNAFALFVRPKMAWASKPIAEVNVQAFKCAVVQNDYAARVLPHGCYLTNLANPDEEKRRKSFECFVDDLQRCALLGIDRFNFHPGSTVGECSMEEGCASIAQCINRAHEQVKDCPRILLENMAGSGNVIGKSWTELGQVIALVVDKSKVGVCLDLCHAFAAGYDISHAAGFDAMLEELDANVGQEYLQGIHINDSKGALGSHKDRHDNVGAGMLGLYPFWRIMNDVRFQGMPMVLETPGEEGVMHQVWSREVEALYCLSGTLYEDDVRSRSNKTIKAKHELKGQQISEGWQRARELMRQVQELRLQGAKAEEEKKQRSQANKTLAKAKARAKVDVCSVEDPDVDEEEEKEEDKSNKNVEQIGANKKRAKAATYQRHAAPFAQQTAPKVSTAGESALVENERGAGRKSRGRALSKG